jgi:uncharacterized phage infection (PIP) family protein YhgE
MNQTIDNFCNQLRSKINDADKRLKDLKASADHASQKAKDEAMAQLDRLENSAKEQQARIEASKAKIKDWVQEKKTMTDDKIAEWKSQRQVKKLADRADDAESYASAAIEIAIASVDEAERAAVEAIVARMDLDAVQPPSSARAS